MILAGENYEKKYWLLLLLPVLIILVLLIKNFKEGQKKELQADKAKEQIVSDTSLPEPTAYPNIQPHCVLLDGKLLMAVGTTDDDLSEKTVGTIQTLLDDPRRLPIIDEQTNFGPYMGCEYAVRDNIFYLKYNGTWNELGNAGVGNEAFYVRLGGKLMQAVGETKLDLSAEVVGTVASKTETLSSLPTVEAQTNYGPYEGCQYAQKDGAWYLCYEEKWYLLQADSGQ